LGLHAIEQAETSSGESGPPAYPPRSVSVTPTGHPIPLEGIMLEWIRVDGGYPPPSQPLGYPALAKLGGEEPIF